MCGITGFLKPQRVRTPVVKLLLMVTHVEIWVRFSSPRGTVQYSTQMVFSRGIRLAGGIAWALEINSHQWSILCVRLAMNDRTVLWFTNRQDE
jgi:hypothetical protein